MVKTLDMRKNPCPIPMIQARRALEAVETAAVVVWVDNEIAVQNLEKMASGLGYGFAVEELGPQHWGARIWKRGAQGGEDGGAAGEMNAQAVDAQTVNAQAATLLISCDQLGRGSEELGRILIKGFLFALTALPVPPRTLLFMNAGVRLVARGSNALADLEQLAAKGTEILACGTCLNYYALTDQLAVGKVTDMYDIASRLAAADRLISL